MSNQSSERSFSPYLPLFLLALALLTNFGFQTFVLVNEAEQLKTAIAGQQKALEEGQAMRGKMQELASHALALADRGNENAALLIDAMRKKRVNIQGNEAATDAPAEQAEE